MNGERDQADWQHNDGAKEERVYSEHGTSNQERLTNRV